MNARCPTCGAELAADGRCYPCFLGIGIRPETDASDSAKGEPPVPLPPGAIPRATEAAGDDLGPFRLLEVLGEGGMGRVWLAEQSEPVRRKVALKVIKPGMDSSQVLARFEAERQALALMDHPNIARVLDAGSTPDGRPFFVMEWVQGQSITRFCEERGLSLPERLRLFMAVCAAIQHAHHKGVIHRDIKPSNVLVTVSDGQAVPKVIDFGVAKAIDQRLTERTLFTQLGAIVGTPEYTSPEQAQLNQADVDTRSDIYSLGILLYELLTGTAPLGREVGRQAAFDEILRRVREEDPPKPSTVLTQPGTDLATISARRGLEPGALVAAVRGDLDWIVMKALEKDRSRRYPTANGLLLDIERHLAQEPVTARPPSRTYRVHKFIRRNRFAVGASTTVLLTLVIGLVVSLWSFAQERRARRRADLAETAQSNLRQKAEVAASNSHEVAQFLTQMLEGVGPAVALGRDTTLLREILDKTDDRIGQELKEQPEVEAELRQALCRVYTDLAAIAMAETNGWRAVELSRRVHGPRQLETAAALDALAGALLVSGKLPEAESRAIEALSIRRELFGNEDPAIAESLNRYGAVLLAEDRPWEAEKLLREAVAIYQHQSETETPRAAEALRNLAKAIHYQGPDKYAEALPIYRMALDAGRAALGNHPRVADLMTSFGELLLDRWKLPDAESVIRQALALRRELLGPNHPDVSDALYLLCDCLLKATKYGDADLEVAKMLPPEADVQPEQVHLLRTRARLNARRSRFQTAANDYSKIIDFDPGNDLHYLGYAPLLVWLNDREAYRRLREIVLARFAGTEPPSFAGRIAKAILLAPLDGMDPAVADRWTAFAIQQNQNHQYLPWDHSVRAFFAYRVGRFEEAIYWCEKTLGNTGPSLSHFRDAQAYAVLAMAQVQLGRLPDARENMARSIESLQSDTRAVEEDRGSVWHDWLITEIHMRELRALMAGQGTEPPAAP